MNLTRDADVLVSAFIELIKMIKKILKYDVENNFRFALYLFLSVIIWVYIFQIDLFFFLIYL